MREAGFYWVSSVGHWGVAYWSAMEGLWFEPGLDSGFSDEEMDKIDERRIVREEVKCSESCLQRPLAPKV